MDIDTLTAQPHPLQSLVDEDFRAVRIAAGDTISATNSDKGELRVWGSFRISASAPIFQVPYLTHLCLGRRRHPWLL